MSNSEKVDYNIQNLDASKLFVGSEVMKTFTIAPAYQTSCEITFHDNKNNKKFLFTPQKDITAFELSHVFRLYAHAAWSNIDVSTFVKENEIERHFTEQ